MTAPRAWVPLGALGVAAIVALSSLGGAASISVARLTASRAVGGNAFTTAASFDVTPPTIGSSVISKTAPYLPGSIRPSAAFYVYTNVTDTGANASGLASVTANVTSIKAGSMSVPLTAGSYSIGGVSYNYRSASLTADAKPTGTYSYSIRATDNAANTSTASFSVVVDSTAPTGSDVQTVNTSGGTAGRPELGDRIILTYSVQVDPESVLPGWMGGSTNVVVRFTNNSGTDSLAIWNAGNSAQLPVGSVSTNGDYVSASLTFGATGTPSTMVQSGSTITITLGTASSTSVKTNGTPKAMAWTPSATATDAAGNACSTTTRTESGSNDVDF